MERPATVRRRATMEDGALSTLAEIGGGRIDDATCGEGFEASRWEANENIGVLVVVAFEILAGNRSSALQSDVNSSSSCQRKG